MSVASWGALTRQPPLSPADRLFPREGSCPARPGLPGAAVPGAGRDHPVPWKGGSDTPKAAVPCAVPCPCQGQGPQQALPGCSVGGNSSPPSLSRGRQHPRQGLGVVPEPSPWAQQRVRAAGINYQAVIPGAEIPREQLSGSKGCCNNFASHDHSPGALTPQDANREVISAAGLPVALGLGPARGFGAKLP